MNLLIDALIIILVVWLVVEFLAPMLPHPFSTIVIIVTVIAIIIWLLKTFIN